VKESFENLLLYRFEYEGWLFEVYLTDNAFRMCSSYTTPSGQQNIRMKGTFKRPSSVERRFYSEAKLFLKPPIGWYVYKTDPMYSETEKLNEALNSARSV
jgi:hypothetical protein